MGYSENTIRKIARVYDVSRACVRDFLAVLESTDEQKSLRADALAHREWAHVLNETRKISQGRRK